MDFKNSYEDNAYAAAYAKLDFPGTYYLAFRDLPTLFSKHVKATKALDFGCGTGRSTRLLTKLGFDVCGVDIADEMIQHARSSDPAGHYSCVADGNLHQFADSTFDLILAAFTFDNIASADKKTVLFSELSRILKNNGKIVNLVSSPNIYLHEWASFSTKDFPENKLAKCGDIVKIIVTDIDDKRPVDDIVWPDEDYRDVYNKANLKVISLHKPLGYEDEPFDWISETTISPWSIYILGKA